VTQVMQRAFKLAGQESQLAAWLLLHGFCCMAFAAWLLALINDPDASDLQAMLLFATCVSQTCFLAVEFLKLVSSNLWQ